MLSKAAAGSEPFSAMPCAFHDVFDLFAPV
jgi:hypothetical protein